MPLTSQLVCDAACVLHFHHPSAVCPPAHSLHAAGLFCAVTILRPRLQQRARFSGGQAARSAAVRGHAWGGVGQAQGRGRALGLPFCFCCCVALLPCPAQWLQSGQESCPATLCSCSVPYCLTLATPAPSPRLFASSAAARPWGRACPSSLHPVDSAPVLISPTRCSCSAMGEGVEYLLADSQPPHLFILRKLYRQSLGAITTLVSAWRSSHA